MSKVGSDRAKSTIKITNMITGKLELTVKINELPKFSNTKNGWFEFHMNCDGIKVKASVKPKVWKKLTDAQANFPMWVASIAGKMGEPIPGGFELLEPAIQVFEKKPKPPKEEAVLIAS